MGTFVDITGNRYGRLIVLQECLPRYRPVKWVCKCDCGVVKDIVGSALKNGATQSCGCLHTEIVKVANITHGHTKEGKRPKLYGLWGSMKDRCSNHKSHSYSDYGGRGITVCQEWLQYEPFSNWALNNGYKVGLEIDRADNNKGYSPENCRWVTRNINARNVRSTKGSSSQYVGVSFDSRRNRWEAAITVNCAKKLIGRFTTEIQAAIARDSYVRTHNLDGFTLNIQ
jgi:hypothetical protein